MIMAISAASVTEILAAVVFAVAVIHAFSTPFCARHSSYS